MYTYTYLTLESHKTFDDFIYPAQKNQHRGYANT